MERGRFRKYTENAINKLRRRKTTTPTRKVDSITSLPEMPDLLIPLTARTVDVVNFTLDQYMRLYADGMGVGDEEAASIIDPDGPYQTARKKIAAARELQTGMPVVSLPLNGKEIEAMAHSVVGDWDQALALADNEELAQAAIEQGGLHVRAIFHAYNTAGGNLEMSKLRRILRRQ